MNTILSQKEWLEYINRLQDRERQKIVSSGLSNWTLFAALAGLGYWILPDIIDIQKHWMTVLFGYIIVNNITVTIFDIFNKYFRQEKIKNFRNTDTLIEKKGAIPLKVHEGIVNIVALSLNGYFVFHSYIRHFWIFEVYFIIYIFRFFPLLQIILKKDEILNLWRKAIGINYIENQDIQGNQSNDNTRKKHRLLFSILIILLNFIESILFRLIITIVTFSYASKHYDFNNLLWKQIFNGLALLIIVVLSQFLLVIFFKRMKIAWLEQLEKEIIINNLREDQIIKKLRYGYYKLSNIDNYF